MSKSILTAGIARPALGALGALLALAAPMAVHAKAGPVERGLEPNNQPVVQRTDFVLDVTPDGYSGLSAAERRRVLDWFDGIGLAYGDRVAIADDGLYSRSGVSTALSGLVGRYGLLLSSEAPGTIDKGPSGTVRIVVSRTTASVPGCPDWRGKSEVDFQGGLSHNYGCSVNGNLAAMVADPQDLVEGRDTHSVLRAATSSRAIQAYQKAAPTGGGGTTLK